MSWRVSISSVALAGVVLAGVMYATRRGVSNEEAYPPLTFASYEHSIDVAARSGLEVWIETDLTKRWLEGRPAFEEGIQRLGALARRPGVAGFKVADELGYEDGFDGDARRISAFLEDTAGSLHRVAPGKLVLIDLLVPSLGCAPGVDLAGEPVEDCMREADARYPALALDQVDGYMRSGALDVVDLSTGILPETKYAGWGIDAAIAQAAAWREAKRRDWDTAVRLQYRRALAHPGAYEGTTLDAERAVTLFVDLPIQQGAAAVDIWTWRQLYDGEIYRLMDPGPRSNPLWRALDARGRRGDRLFTHFTPSSVEMGTEEDVRTIAQVFSAVFIAAGIG